jgi:hypothetical protein
MTFNKVVMMNKILKPIVETLHCNVSTALLLMLLCFNSLAFAALNEERL